MKARQFANLPHSIFNASIYAASDLISFIQFLLMHSSSADVTIPARGKCIVPTDLSIAVPPGCYGRVAPRSGLAVKHFLDVGAGVIDEDYRGAVGVVM